MEQIGMLQNKFFNIKKSVILSASRMTDMPKYYANELIEEVEKRINKGFDIHTLVLWTKHADSLLNNNLKSFIEKLKENHILIFLHLTITGMGGMVIGNDLNGDKLYIEKNAPKLEKSLGLLDDIKELLGNPQLIRIRIDPIIRVKNLSDGVVFTNIKYFEYIVNCAAKVGIKNFSMSFLESTAYKKIRNRFNKLGWEIMSPNDMERVKFSKWLIEIEKKYNVNIYSCCVPGLEESRCVDGYLLEKLHYTKKPVDKGEPRKRLLCGCTCSTDIGGWPPKKCFTGCQYCYANPS